MREKFSLALAISSTVFMVGMPFAQATVPATVSTACRNVLNLSPSDDEFQACTASLSDSVDRAAHFQALALASRAAADACAA